MKKVIMTGLLAALSVAVNAEIYTAFKSSFGFAASDGSSVLLQQGEQAMIQLIYAGANGVIDGVATPGGGIQNLVDDVILYQGLTQATTAGDDFTEWGIFSGVTVREAAYNGGYVYGRIFQDSVASADSWYYTGAVELMSDFTYTGGAVPLPDDEYDLGNGAAVFVDQQVIPEPATIGLMGIAGMGMFLARRKTRR